MNVRSLLRLDTDVAMRRGSVLHGWLERLGWIEDGVPDPDELIDAAALIAPDMPARDVRELLGRFREQIMAPSIHALLSRASYPPGATIARELRFLHREGDTLIEGTIDRLVLEFEEGRVVRAEVLDFKTDQIERAGLAERARHYQPQLAAYCRAVGKMYRLEEKAVTGKLVFLQIGEVATIEPR